jgi:beta-lactamase superfamily II metal-dependent hydrolase
MRDNAICRVLSSAELRWRSDWASALTTAGMTRRLAYWHYPIVWRVSAVMSVPMRKVARRNCCGWRRAFEKTSESLVNFEIEFLPVGEASKAGDAIVLRYEASPGYFCLMVIDGGNVDSGKEVVSHIHKHYGDKAIVVDAVLTHCDADHACGFREVLQELDVRNVWMHLPWLAAPGSLSYFADKSLTAESLAKKLRAEYDLIDEIYGVAVERGMKVFQPFAGQKIGPFTVLSPGKSIYELLLPQFDRTPEADQTALEAVGLWIGKPPGFFAKLADLGLAKAEKWVKETWENERLKDGGETSATNESSVVLYGDFGPSHRVLLTGDAGHWALALSAYQAEKSGLPMQQFSFVQIPHHGSRSNVGPTILNRIVGPILPKGSGPKFSAYVSAPKDDDAHPRKMVLNAFIRRGGSVVATQGQSKCHTIGYPFKPGYIHVTSMPFSDQVEDYD